MGLKKNWPTQPLDGTMRANIVYKLQKIIADIEERRHANLTRLTVLKKWFGAPRRISSFAICQPGIPADAQNDEGSRSAFSRGV
jgi:hypothetical protein